MNWSKAKTILIIIFLIADVFLFYVTYTGDIRSIGHNNKENTLKIIEHLQKQGIIVKGTIPSKGNPAPLLYVKYKSLSKEEGRRIFFDSHEAVRINEKSDKIKFESNDALLELGMEGQILYYNNSIDEGGENVDEELAQKNIEDFLLALDINKSDLIEIKKEKTKSYIKVNYSQSYKNQFIDNTHLEIKATDNSIIYAKLLWFDSIKNGKTKNEVIAPVKALMKLSEIYRDEDTTVTVEEINQGFLFNIGAHQAFDVASVEEGTAMPVWRIKTDMGNIYINAYNGTVEGN